MESFQGLFLQKYHAGEVMKDQMGKDLLEAEEERKEGKDVEPSVQQH